MEIIELPAWRLRSEARDRSALRSGVASSRPVMALVTTGADAVLEARYCDRCAGPIEFGAVTNAIGTYCSVECSLAGPGRLA